MLMFIVINIKFVLNVEIISSYYRMGQYQDPLGVSDIQRRVAEFLLLL